ncbi:hypothetical protein N658DRAFT_492798 [Parathielavia hyrcaniae]|uniref:Uncharacterized protein n=1 Tax=Parathielavia hyrcaniae TaxID=113614 RepID=A0AAN6QAH4_9PEZI|nr:hypothetical protein N658DRAFT_492798 [Parathielavia hyrcaniae]
MDTASTLDADSDAEWVHVRRHTSVAGKRLFWRLNGPLEAAIQVAPSEYYEPGDMMEPYFGPDGSPHPVSQESLLEPPVSSITARAGCFDRWEETWNDAHQLCGEYDDWPYPRRLGPRPDDENLESPTRLYLLECCGEKRPWPYDTYLQVTAQGEFLTVHEYVSAVHPWLMAMRDTILDLLGKFHGNPKLPPETKLAVIHLRPHSLDIGREDRWASSHRKPPVRDPAKPLLPHEELQRRSMARALARSAARIRAREEEAAALIRGARVD